LQSANIQLDPGTLEKRAFMRQRDIINRLREVRVDILSTEGFLRVKRREQKELTAALLGVEKKEKKS